jgi:DNA invertase Pin-like site-specific DNA recombinase
MTREKMAVPLAQARKADLELTVRDATKEAGVSASTFCRVSGMRDDHPGLSHCLKALREGDTLVVWKLCAAEAHI